VKETLLGRRILGMAAALLVGGVGLAACSSGPSSTSTGPTTTASTAPSKTTTSSGPSSTSTSSTSAGLSRCATAKLAGSVVGGSGAAGTIETTVGLRNTASTSCTLGGYPGLQLLGTGGATLPTTVVRKGNYPFTAMAPTTVTLAPGQSANFNIGYSDVPVGNQTSCPTSVSLQITPPNAYDHLVITASLGPCGNGTMTVSPVFPATGSST
jgi:Protein of unknown function (DUF4232)